MKTVKDLIEVTGKKRWAREVSEEVMTKSTVISIVSLKVYVFS